MSRVVVDVDELVEALDGEPHNPRALLRSLLQSAPRLDLIGVAEVARIFDVAPSNVSRLRRGGQLPEPIPVAGDSRTPGVYLRQQVEDAAKRPRRGPGRPPGEA